MMTCEIHMYEIDRNTACSLPFLQEGTGLEHVLITEFVQPSSFGRQGASKPHCTLVEGVTRRERADTVHVNRQNIDREVKKNLLNLNYLLVKVKITRW